MRSAITKNVLIVGVGVLVLIGIGTFGAVRRWNSPPPVVVPPSVAPPAGAIVIRGTMLCLPHKDTRGPQTLECAFGLRDLAGRYYALRDTDPMYGNVGSAPMNVMVEAKGDFEPGSHQIYPIVGTIAVSEIIVLP